MQIRIIYSILLIQLTSLCNAQDLSFDYYSKNTKSTNLKHAVEDSEGNFYVISEIEDPNNFPNIQSPVLKISAQGHLINSSDLGFGSSQYNISQILKLDNDEFLAVGNSKLSDNPNSAIFLIKFDKNFDVIWNKSLKDSTSGLFISQIKYSLDKSKFIAIGSTVGKETALFKFNLNGDSLFQKNYQFNGIVARFMDLLELPSNQGYFIFSYGTHMPGDTNPSSLSVTKLMRTDDLGVIDTVLNLETSLTYPHFSSNVAFNNNVTAKWITPNSFLVGGILYNPQSTIFNHPSDDLGMMVWNTNYQEEYYKIFGSPDSNEFSGLKVMDFVDTSEIYIAGIDNFYIDPFEDELVRFYVIKTNSKGKITWEKKYSNNSHLRFNSVLATSDGGVLISGRTYKEGFHNNDQSDGYLLKLDSDGEVEIWPVGMNEFVKYNSKINIKMFPNPVRTTLNVELFNAQELAKLVLYNSLGVRIKTYNLNNGLNQFSTISLSPGVYFYEVLNTRNERIHEGKLLKR